MQRCWSEIVVLFDSALNAMQVGGPRGEYSCNISLVDYQF